MASSSRTGLSSPIGYKYSADTFVNTTTDFDDEEDEDGDETKMDIEKVTRLPPPPKRSLDIIRYKKYSNVSEDDIKSDLDINVKKESMKNMRKVTTGGSEEEMKSGIIAAGIKAAKMTAGGPKVDANAMIDDDVKKETENKEESWQEVPGEKNRHRALSSELEFNVSVTALNLSEGREDNQSDFDGIESKPGDGDYRETGFEPLEEDEEDEEDEEKAEEEEETQEITQEIEIDSLFTMQPQSLSPQTNFIQSVTELNNLSTAVLYNDSRTGPSFDIQEEDEMKERVCVETSDDYQFSMFLDVIGDGKNDELSALEETPEIFGGDDDNDDDVIDGLNVNEKTLDKLGETELFGFRKLGKANKNKQVSIEDSDDKDIMSLTEFTITSDIHVTSEGKEQSTKTNKNDGNDENDENDKNEAI